MKFDRMPQRGSIFTEVFNSGDWRHFQVAYSDKRNPKPKVPRYLDKTLAPSREWVKDVIHVWARALPINFALAVSVIQTGDYHAIQRHYKRMRDVLYQEREGIQKADVSDEARASMMELWNATFKEVNIVCEWGDGDLANWARAAWVDALTLPHPHVKRNEFSGRVTPANNKKAESTTEVKSKRPKAKKTGLEVAAA